MTLPRPLAALRRAAAPAALGAATFAALAATPAAALDLTRMTEAERAAFGAQVRAYLMENPQVILEAVNQLEAQQAEAQASQDATLVKVNEEEIFRDGVSWVGGNPDGDITLVEFMDYRCGYCRKAAPEVEALLKEDGNIRYIVKEFPILGPESLEASKFAIATRQVAGDAAYKQVHDALMDYTGRMDARAFRRIAGTLELDADPILERMEDESVLQEIAQNRALAQRLKISGTPTFVLEDEMLRGYLPKETMAEIAAEVRG